MEPQSSCVRMQKIMLTSQGLERIKCPKNMYGNRRCTENDNLFIFEMIVLLNNNDKQTNKKQNTIAHKSQDGKISSFVVVVQILPL